MPEPSNPESSASAKAANDYVNNLGEKNPFTGLSREQLSTIANDESGSFTTNEKYAAYRQAYDEEQKWRSEVVAKAMQEYEDTGKLTNFFKSALSHFNELPIQEQSLYSEEYAKDLEEKIDLDFNYFTHMGHGLPGQANESLASLNKGPGFEISKLISFPSNSLGYMPRS